MLKMKFFFCIATVTFLFAEADLLDDAIIFESSTIESSTVSPTCEPGTYYFSADGEPLFLIYDENPNFGNTSLLVEDQVKFHLYNNHDLGNPTEIYPNCTDCLGSFHSNADTYICAHGFASSYMSEFGTNLRRGFAELDETANIIFVDWESLAIFPWYGWAMRNNILVGQYTARLIEFLVSTAGSPFYKFHFIGHSLGSHMGNHIAMNISLGKLPRITALDPAYPCYSSRPDTERIDPSDADFVNVIHSSAYSRLVDGLGIGVPSGHVDFYPNGGASPQPGCEYAFSPSAVVCSHSKAHEYIGNSIFHPNTYIGCQCESWEHFKSNCQHSCPNRTVMGFNTPTSARGIYYLHTENQGNVCKRVRSSGWITSLSVMIAIFTSFVCIQK